MCPDCYNTRIPRPIPTPILPPTPYMQSGPRMMPIGGVLCAPFPRRPFLLKYWWVPAALFFVAAALIGINAAALLSPVFFSAWASLFPWVIPIGYFSFILGIVLSLIIIGALALYFLGFRVLSAFLVFPSAILSLFIGGGFLVGVIFGVLGALLVMFAQRLYPWN